MFFEVTLTPEYGDWAAMPYLMEVVAVAASESWMEASYFYLAPVYLLVDLLLLFLNYVEVVDDCIIGEQAFESKTAPGGETLPSSFLSDLNLFYYYFESCYYFSFTELVFTV